MKSVPERYFELMSLDEPGIDLAEIFPMVQDLDEAVQSLEVLRECIDSFRPFNEAQVSKLREAYDVQYTYESNRIEGNTLTLQETAMVVNEGLTIAGKSLREHLEAKNHSQSIQLIRDLVRNQAALNISLIQRIHATVLAAIDTENAGKFRRVSVEISGSRHYPPQPKVLDQLMNDYIKFYDDNAGLLPDVLLAAQMHQKLVHIHPFIDGNGRTARLIMNFILMKSGFPIANLKGDHVSRQDYYRTLETAHVEKDIEPFQLLIINSVRESCLSWLKNISMNLESETGELFFEIVSDYMD